MMASTSRLSRADRVQRRADLVIRPLPEIRMCMVYRPRPARVVTLNPSSWMLLEACAGATTVAEVEDAYTAAMSARGRTVGEDEVRSGLQALIDLSLLTTGARSELLTPTTDKE